MLLLLLLLLLLLPLLPLPQPPPPPPPPLHVQCTFILLRPVVSMYVSRESADCNHIKFAAVIFYIKNGDLPV
jgi:hypothetical protein